MPDFRRTIPLFALLAGLLLAACGHDASRPPTPTLVLPKTYTPTATPLPPTPTPTATPTPPATTTPTPAPSPTATIVSFHHASINGVPYEEFIIMDDEVRAHVREIFAHGLKMGRNPFVFSKMGDSIIANKHFLRDFDGKDPNLRPYNLGAYAHLQDTIDYYSGSFDRSGAAVRPGLNSLMILNPRWTDNEDCLPKENMVDCEIRLNNPSVAIIQLGTNDRANVLAINYDRLVAHLIEEGIIPILFTKADRGGGPNNENNEIIRWIANKYKVPLIDFDRLADTLPHRGLKSDNTHLSAAPRFDYSNPDTFRYGDAIHNLSALMMLDEVRAAISGQAP